MWRQVMLKFCNLKTVLLVFIASRAVLYSLRKFNLDLLHSGWQFLDPQLMRTDLLGALAFLHSQPPGFNFFLGSIVSIIPESLLSTAFASLYFLMGLAVSAFVFKTLQTLGVHSGVAFGLTLFQMLWFLSVERWLFYTYPIVLLMVLSGYFILRVEQGKSSLIPAFSAMAALVLIRGFFHAAVWFLPLFVGLLWLNRNRNGSWKRSAVAGLALLLCTSYPYISNWWQYGVFTSSTWFGMNIARLTIHMPKDEVRALADSGEITPISLITPFAPTNEYLKYFKERGYFEEKFYNHPSINNPYKSNGFPNYNHWIYISAAREYGENTKVLIQKFPLEYLHAVGDQAYSFFSRKSYMNILEWESYAFAGEGFGRMRNVIDYLILPVLMLTGFCLAVHVFTGQAIEGIKRRKLSSFVFFAVYNIVYITTIALLFERGEGCFMRIPMDPLVFAGIGLFITKLLPLKQIHAEEDMRKMINRPLQETS